MVPLLVWWFLFNGLTSTSSPAAATDTYSIFNSTTISKPRCKSKCGNVTVPYPFGIGSGCAINSGFELNCTDALGPPRALIRDSQVFEISDNHIRISNVILEQCFDETGSLVKSDTTGASNISGTSFSYSDLNNFTVVGCDDGAVWDVYITGKTGHDHSECNSTCSRKSLLKDNISGYCQSSINKGSQYYETRFSSNKNHTEVFRDNKCGYAFLGEWGSYKYQATDLSNRNFVDRVQTTVPIVLDWAIENSTCGQVMSNSSEYACKSYSYCVDSNRKMGGYRCSCVQGYQGNPYLDGGCTAVDECADPNLKDCEKICACNVSSSNCSCPSGDGRNHPFPITTVVLGAGFAVLSLLIFVIFIYLYIKKRNLVKLRENFFKRNGGFILQQRIAFKDSDSVESTKIFLAEDLINATNSYADNRIIGKGGYGTVYRGILPDKSVVAIKKSTTMDVSQIEQFINEVIILTQINHRNVVKLLGCCLETEVPILVYEFVSNGTLFEHIHNNGLSWGNRLRIASEAAGALAYLHSAASTPIIHRDVKSTNILLDEYYTAKISDFGASRLIPLDQKKVTTMVIGTFGYLDPEYFHTRHLTEKSDVYSFAVVLIELMTGRKPLDMEKSEDQRCLTVFFVTSLNENRLFQILEARVVREGSLDQLQAMAELIRRCLQFNRKERPTMKEVATEIEALRKLTNSSWKNNHNDDDQESVNLNEAADLYTVPAVSVYGSTGEFSGKYSSSSYSTQMLIGNSD